jgi:hypothetical protein
MDALRKFFREKSVDLCLNYPDEDLKLPAIVILLKSENESQAFLGNLQQDETSIRRMGNPFPADELEGAATILGRGSESSTGIGPQTQLQPVQVTAADAGSFRIAPGFINLIDPFEDDVFVVVLEGTGAGQKRQVISITPETHSTHIVVTPAWETILDTSSIIKLVSPSDLEGITGEPSKLFTTDDALERRGSIYKTSYYLLVIGPNPELTIFLYTAVKAMFIIGMDFMIKQGIMNFQMSGTDFAPRPEYIPTLAYQRALTVEFEYSFDVIVPLDEPSARYLRVVVSTPDPVDDPDGLDSVGLDTIINLLPP